MLATASYRLYAAAIAARLGFDDVIATDTRTDAQRPDRRAGSTAAIATALGKLDMIEAWLQREGLERDAVHIRFYSDHVSDAPVHHWSDEAFATNAHARLVRLAETRGLGGARLARPEAGLSLTLIAGEATRNPPDSSLLQ